MSEVTITRVERLFLLFSKRRSGQTVVGLEESDGSHGETLDVQANFKSKEKMPELTITAIARLARVSPSTLRYYEKIGILPPARRVGGRRRYDLSTLKQLEFITYTKQAGFRLRQIQALQEGLSRGKAPARLWRDEENFVPSAPSATPPRDVGTLSMPKSCRMRRPSSNEVKNA